MLNLSQSKIARVFVLFVLPTVIWGSLFLTRPLTYSLKCAQTPTPCTISSISSLDQLAFQSRSITSDFYSNVVQNSMGIIAFLFPWLILAYRRRRLRRLTDIFAQTDALRDAIADTAILLACSCWNGAILETTRLLVQRPRPLVYDNPAVEGLNSLHYTSFYSGHTSFVALATLNMFFMLKRKRPHSLFLMATSLSFFVFWTALTGFLRVHGGRHFPTDVIAGAAVGVLIALFWNSRPSQTIDI